VQIECNDLHSNRESLYSCILLIYIAKTNIIFLDNCVSIYFLAVGMKLHFKAESYIDKVVCALTSLMNERSMPTIENENNENIEDFVNSFNQNNTSEETLTP